MALGMLRKAQAHGIRCHYDGPGHKTLIPAGQGFYEVREGKAQGIYHGTHCYEAALKKYRALEEKSKHTIISSDEEDDYELSGIDDQY